LGGDDKKGGLEADITNALGGSLCGIEVGSNGRCFLESQGQGIAGVEEDWGSRGIGELTRDGGGQGKRVGGRVESENHGGGGVNFDSNLMGGQTLKLGSLARGGNDGSDTSQEASGGSDEAKNQGEVCRSEHGQQV
jgi:hypothetical protein